MLRLALRALVATLVAVPVVLARAPAAYGFELTTNYPAVRVGPGQRVEMPLAVTSGTVERVALAVAQAPAGWQTRLTGGGFEVSAVFTDPAEPPEVTLEVAVPPDTAPGVHQVVVRGEAGGSVIDLPLSFEVAENVAGAFQLTAEFARLRGSNTDTFPFDVTLESRSPREASFALAASGPPGWQVTARPSTQQQAASVTVEPGGTATIDVEADPPDDVPAGTYPIVLQANGAGTTLETQLEVEVEGTFAMAFATANERLDVDGSAGDTTSVALVLRNDGSAPLRDVSLSGTPPSGWEVTFEPERVDAVAPGEAVQVTARIRPDGDAVAGDYAVTLRASGSGQDQAVDLRFSVETSAWWGFVGLAVIAIAVAALLWVFRRFGRR